MLKITSFVTALAAMASLAQAAPMLAERSPPTLHCSASSIWTNGTLAIGGAFDGPSQEMTLAVRQFTNETTGKTESRLSKWVEGRSDLFKLSNVGGQFCNSTTFNYSYVAPDFAYEKADPLRIRTLDFGLPSGYGYNYSTCLGVGTSFDTPLDRSTYKLPTTGTYPVSVQECSEVDYQELAATQAQFFQRVYKFGFIITANGYATGQNPPEGWNLVIDDDTGDIMVTSDDPDPNDSLNYALFINSNQEPNDNDE